MDQLQHEMQRIAKVLQEQTQENTKSPECITSSLVRIKKRKPHNKGTFATQISAITDNIDSALEEKVFEHRPVKSWRWDSDQDKWRGRGKGQEEQGKGGGERKGRRRGR